MGEPFLKLKANIINKKTNVTFKNLPYDNYSIMAYHDKNDNNIMDHSFGFPDEPFAYSNNWYFSLFSGLPNFGKTKFNFSKDDLKCVIKFK